MATFFSLNVFELFPVRFSCSNNINLSHNSLGLSEKKLVFNPDASIAPLLK